MGMTIEDTKMNLVLQEKYALGKDYRALENALDIIRKYQKIKEILKNDTYYEEYGNNAERFIVSAISEVLEDGNDD